MWDAWAWKKKKSAFTVINRMCSVKSLALCLCVCPAFHQSLWVSDKVRSSFSDYFSHIKTIHKVVLCIANREHRCRSASLNLIKLLLLIRARAKVFAIKHNLRSPAFEKSHVGYRAFGSTWYLLVPQHEALSFHVGKHHIWQKASVCNNQCYLYCDHQERSLCWDVLLTIICQSISADFVE